jgi:hypothetical protein
MRTKLSQIVKGARFMTVVKRSRRSFLRDAARVAAVGAGGLLGMSASSAEACSIYCRYSHTNNVLGDPNCAYGYDIFYCTSVCDGSTFKVCRFPHNSRPGFCLSNNAC